MQTRSSEVESLDSIFSQKLYQSYTAVLHISLIPGPEWQPGFIQVTWIWWARKILKDMHNCLFLESFYYHPCHFPAARSWKSYSPICTSFPHFWKWNIINQYSPGDPAVHWPGLKQYCYYYSKATYITT